MECGSKKMGGRLTKMKPKNFFFFATIFYDVFMTFYGQSLISGLLDLPCAIYYYYFQANIFAGFAFGAKSMENEFEAL
jgi:hypothetical protein